MRYEFYKAGKLELPADNHTGQPHPKGNLGLPEDDIRGKNPT
jgi:hypothetical protein